MKVLTITVISLSLFARVASQAQTSVAKAMTSSSIKISRSDSLQPKKASAEYFTGSVQVQELFPAYDPSRTSGGKVTFEPGARGAWHIHPLGQVLIVTDGTGWVQQWGGPIEEIRKGDIVWDPSGSETLARRNTEHRYDAHCNTGTTQRESRAVDGEGDRRAIPQVI